MSYVIVLIFFIGNALAVLLYGDKIKPMKITKKFSGWCLPSMTPDSVYWFFERFMTIFIVAWLGLLSWLIILGLGQGLANLITGPSG